MDVCHLIKIAVSLVNLSLLSICSLRSFSFHLRSVNEFAGGLEVLVVSIGVYALTRLIGIILNSFSLLNLPHRD